jgi:hypothetical protein
MTHDEHEQQLTLVQQSLALSPSNAERHNVCPARRTCKHCPTCLRLVRRKRTVWISLLR